MEQGGAQGKIRFSFFSPLGHLMAFEFLIFSPLSGKILLFKIFAKVRNN